MTPRPILITGGAGFIGTHLARALLSAGIPVRCLDLKKTRVAHALLDARIGDVRNPETVRAAVQGTDAVFHFAALASVEVCQKEPRESYETNVWGTLQVLEALREEAETRAAGNAPRLIFSGSASVYGAIGKPGVPISEETPLPTPLSFYAAQKLASEEMIRQYAHAFSLPATVFRFFNVYGEGQDPLSPYSGVISIFLHRLSAGQELRLYGGGHQTRDYVSVHDLVRALSASLDLDPGQCLGEPINLGSGTATTVRELADLLLLASGKRVPIVEAPPREGDVPHSRADVKRAEEKLSWKAVIPIGEGLRALLRTTSISQ